MTKHEETAKGFRLSVSLGDIMIVLEELKNIRKTVLENPDCVSGEFAEHLQVAIDVIKLFIADHYADEVRYGMERLEEVLEQISEIAREMDSEEEA